MALLETIQSGLLELVGLLGLILYHASAICQCLGASFHLLFSMARHFLPDILLLLMSCPCSLASLHDVPHGEPVPLVGDVETFL